MKTGSPPAIPSLFLCVGPEKWLRRQAIRRIKPQCVTPDFEEMDVVSFSEPPGEERALLEAARTTPFGSLRRLVVVEGLKEIGPRATPWLASYLAHPSPTTCMILCADELDQEMKFPESSSGSATVQIIPCQPLKGKMLQEWIMNQGCLKGTSLDPAAANLLMTRVGTELQLLEQMLEILSLFVGSSRRVTTADVEKSILPSARETAFDILDTAAGGHPEVAIKMLRQALAQGSLTVEQCMGALGWYYRMAWKVNRNSGGRSGWTSPRRQAALARLARWPERRLQEALEGALRADEGLKLGTPAPELLMDQLLLKLGN